MSFFANDTLALYDFLFIRDYDAWFCNMVRAVSSSDRRGIKDLILKLHTGEALAITHRGWSLEARKRLGQEYLNNLTADCLKEAKPGERFDPWGQDNINGLLEQLDLSGYRFDRGQLLIPESDVLDADEQSGVIEDLYSQIGLPEKPLVLSTLNLSAEHFLAKRWADSISNSRKFLEAVLKQTANRFALHAASSITSSDLEKPVRVREHIEAIGLLERKEREALDKIYGLLSHTGAHPYMAEEDQARLLRNLALTMTHFVLLRAKSMAQGSP